MATLTKKSAKPESAPVVRRAPRRYTEKQSEAMRRRALARKLFPKPKRTPEQVAEARRAGAEKRRVLKDAKAASEAALAHLTRMAELAEQAESSGITIRGLDKLAVELKPPKPRTSFQKKQDAEAAERAERLEKWRLYDLAHPPPPRLTSEPGDETHAEALLQNECEDYSWWLTRKRGVESKYAMSALLARLGWTADADADAWEWTKCKTRLEAANGTFLA